VPISLLLAERLGWESAVWLISALRLDAYGGLYTKLPTLPSAPVLSLVRKLAILRSPHAMAILAVSLLGAVGWALQVPQNNELVRARQGALFMPLSGSA